MLYQILTGNLKSLGVTVAAGGSIVVKPAIVPQLVQGSIITLDPQSAVVDSSGNFTISLAQTARVRMTATDGTGKQCADISLHITDDATANLSMYLEAAPPDPLKNLYISAALSAETAGNAAIAAAGSETAAGVSAGIASDAAVAADLSAGIASDAAVAAGLSAGTASAAAIAAGVSAGIASDAAVAAAGYAATVSTHAGLTTGVHGLGTASQLNVPASGNASISEVVYGTDTRLTDTRNTTAAITFAASGGAAAGSTFNGSVARTVDYTTVGAAAASHTHSYQAADADLLAIGGLVGTTGFLKKTAADTWTLDTAAYMPLAGSAGQAFSVGLLAVTGASINGGTGAGSGYNATINMSRTTTNANVLGAKLVLIDDPADATNYGNLVFRVKSTASGAESASYYTDALTVMSRTQSVLIGMTTPVTGTKLEVAGSVSLSNVVYPNAGGNIGTLDGNYGMFMYASGGYISTTVAGVERSRLSATGLAVIGAISATNNIECLNNMSAGTTISATTCLNLLGAGASYSSLRLNHGIAPTAPTDGDCWTTTTGMFIRINGVTKTVTLT